MKSLRKQPVLYRMHLVGHANLGFSRTACLLTTNPTYVNGSKPPSTICRLNSYFLEDLRRQLDASPKVSDLTQKSDFSLAFF